MYNEIPIERRRELDDAFDQFDKNKDGYITEKELLSVMQSLGQNPTKEEVKALFKEADLNGDGQITSDEFIEIMVFFILFFRPEIVIYKLKKKLLMLLESLIKMEEVSLLLMN